MSVMKKNKQEITSNYRQMIRRIGQHEVGHFIVARVLGFKTGSITLTITDLLGGHRAGSEIIPSCALSGDQEIIDYLERRVTVLYSGAHAESLFEGQLNNEHALQCVQSGGGVRDYDKVRELIQLIRNLKYPSATTEYEIQSSLSSIENELWNRAAAIVETEHLLIEGLGDRLASEMKYVGETFTLSEEELDSLPVIRDRFGKNETSANHSCSGTACGSTLTQTLNVRQP